jgi:beta-glucosidase-like glycosyl hydrolase
VNPARLVLPALRWSGATGFQHEAQHIADALQLGVGGFIIFGGDAEAVSQLVVDLRNRSSSDLLIASDLERGAGQQFRGLSELPPPRALAALQDADAIFDAGRVTAAEARSLGIDWVFAPVADLDSNPANPIVQTRSFGAEPSAVADCVAQWVRGCHAGGALSCIKHFPGHGRTSTDSHAGLPVVPATVAELESEDWLPFRAGIAAGTPAVMTGHIAYPAIDPSRKPATVSPVIMGLLRQRLNFGGAVVSDALIMEGAFEGRSESDAYREAVNAGVDLLLYPRDLKAAVRAISDGSVPGARLAEAAARQEALLKKARALPSPPVTDGAKLERSLADLIVGQGMRRGEPPTLAPPFELLVVDDDIGGPYPPSPGDYVEQELLRLGVALGNGGSRIVLAFAEPRAWKERSGLSAENHAKLAAAVTGADLVVHFAHERLLADVPEGPPVLLAWHRQRPLQLAVARWLAARCVTAG